MNPIFKTLFFEFSFFLFSLHFAHLFSLICLYLFLCCLLLILFVVGLYLLFVSLYLI